MPAMSEKPSSLGSLTTTSMNSSFSGFRRKPLKLHVVDADVDCNSSCCSESTMAPSAAVDVTGWPAEGIWSQPGSPRLPLTPSSYPECNLEAAQAHVVRHGDVRTPSTGLLSVGSSLHGIGDCRPCAWFWKAQGCHNGRDCTRCHLCLEGEIKNRKKTKLALLRADCEETIANSEGTSKIQRMHSTAGKVHDTQVILPESVLPPVPANSPSSPAAWQRAAPEFKDEQAVQWRAPPGLTPAFDLPPIPPPLCPPSLPIETSLEEGYKAWLCFGSAGLHPLQCSCAACYTLCSAEFRAWYKAKLAGIPLPPLLPSVSCNYPTGMQQVPMFFGEIQKSQRRTDQSEVVVSLLGVLKEHVPATEAKSLQLSENELPSRGSALHHSGRCTPCAWFWKPQGCKNGKDCGRCHLCIAGEVKARKKAKAVAMRAMPCDENKVIESKPVCLSIQNFL
jgi:hypothetical protein